MKERQRRHGNSQVRRGNPHLPGQRQASVDKLNIDIEDGEFLVLVGPSGCGKSTSLRMLAGLEEVNEGRIWIGDRDVTNLSPKDRDVAMVFQNYALYPHMSVADNMGFALKIAGVDKAEINKRVQEAAKILDLEPYLERKPKALSVGSASAWPWAARSSSRRSSSWTSRCRTSTRSCVQTRTQIASLQRRLGVTTVYVTHDQVEAMTMGDRVAVLKDGLLMQCDTPRRMYDHPNNVFVAGFIGSPAMNLLDVEVIDGGVSVSGSKIAVERDRLQLHRQAGHPRCPPGGPRDDHRGPRHPRDRGRRRGARRRRVHLRLDQGPPPRRPRRVRRRDPREAVHRPR